MKKLFLFHALVCSVLIPGFSQNAGNISGRVLSDDGLPIAFATIILYNAVDSVMAKANSSQNDGTFALIGVNSGTYFLEVTYVGFAKHTGDVFSYTAPGNTQVANIILHATSEQLDEVVVVSTRPIVEVHPDKTVFNVQGSVNATGNTALELLRKSPGVVVDNNENVILAGKSGVKIYIDGKPSPLSSEDLANYLKTMQSTEIDAIEIITNPSAKYEAEGNAGIINLRLVKDKSLGANGALNLGYRYGKSSKYNASGNFNYRNQGSNVFGSYGFNTGDHFNNFSLVRELNDINYDQINNMINSNTSHNFKFGTDFFLNKKSTLGFLVNGNINNNENHGRSNTDIGPVGGGVESILAASNDVNGDRNNWNFNLNYAWRGANSATWNIDADHGRFRNDAESLQPNMYIDAATGDITSERTFTALTPTEIDIYTLKFDHERQVLKGNLGFGAKFSLVNTDNTYDFFDIIDDSPVLNIDRSNNFVFEENINAAYTSYQRPLSEKWNLMLGVRVENTHSTGTLTSQKPGANDIVERDYTDVFPSAGLTYQVNQKHSLRLNFSRRIDRPSYQDLNPFEFKLDELSFMKGNAFLNPQYSNSLSLTHTFNYRLNTSLSFTQTKDMFTRITEALDDTTSVLTFVNLAKQTNLALTVSYPFEVNKWWSVYGNITGYRMHNEADIDGDIIDLDANVLSFYAQNTFLLPQGMKLELSGWYNSPGLWEGNWTTNSMYSIDAGIQKSLLKDAATLKISLSDIFNTQRWSGESDFGELRMHGGGSWESRQIRFNFTYLIGNKQVKGARQRQTGLEEEQGRIKTDN
ncbi:MAG TPA: TonB-dependent receptor [Saprospiraceae bacterium]|nr:TonB-dependent receptor [Saprospiraceae bacterium]